jgi:manganese efflux pump family protein
MIAVLLLGLALGLDSFRASLAMGASGLGGARAFRVALAFGACDGVAPLVGLALSRATVVYVASWSALIAPAVLIGSGAYVLLKRLEDEQDEPQGG